MRKKAEGITQTKRLCTFFLFFSFFLLFFFSSSLFSIASSRRRREMVVEILVLQISFRLCNSLSSLHPVLSWLPPSRCTLQRIRSFRRAFFNSSRSWGRRRRRRKKGAEEKKKRKEPVQRLVGWLVEERRQFFDPSSVHAHEGIQMQEVTHPVRSIYRSQDRAFIRSVLDTRDGELWSWIYFHMCVFFTNL